MMPLGNNPLFQLHSINMSKLDSKSLQLMDMKTICQQCLYIDEITQNKDIIKDIRMF